MHENSSIDLLLRNLFVSGAFLDKDGFIIEVSEGWKQFARSGNLAFENFGVGENYLRHSLFPDDPSSASTLRGLKALLDKEIDVFSTIYPCDVPTGQRWFLLVGFAVDGGSRAAAVLHVDISELLRHKTNVSASMVGVGSGAFDPTLQFITRTIRRTISESLKNFSGNSTSPQNSTDQKMLRSLTAHQRILLAHVARGATNSEIAKAQNISVGSVKNQTTALIRRLGVTNRTQAALMAVRSGLLDEA